MIVVLSLNLYVSIFNGRVVWFNYKSIKKYCGLHLMMVIVVVLESYKW